VDSIEQDPLFHHGHQDLEDPFEERDKTYVPRQWLSFAFILTTIAGIACWYIDKESHQLACYILIAAVIIKFIEAALRLMKPLFK